MGAYARSERAPVSSAISTDSKPQATLGKVRSKEALMGAPRVVLTYRWSTVFCSKTEEHCDEARRHDRYIQAKCNEPE